MPSPKTTTIASLLVLGLALAAANLWFAAARSTIPLRLDAIVEGKETRHEKHPPKDDVCLLNLGLQGILQVDQVVFDGVNVGDHVRKDTWSRVLECNGRKLDLAWSADTRGLSRVMPLALAVMFVLTLCVPRMHAVS